MLTLGPADNEDVLSKPETRSERAARIGSLIDRLSQLEERVKCIDIKHIKSDEFPILYEHHYLSSQARLYSVDELMALKEYFDDRQARQIRQDLFERNLGRKNFLDALKLTATPYAYEQVVQLFDRYS